MKKLVALVILLVNACLPPMASAQQISPDGAQVVATCGTPAATYTAGQVRQITQNTGGQLCGAATVTPSGTQDINLKQVNGAAVNVGVGAASTGTQRVTTSSDSSLTLLPSAAAANGLSVVVSTALESCHVLKSGAGNLYTLTALLTSASGIVLAFDAISAPGDGAVTPVWFGVANSNGTNGGFSAAWPANAPLAFSTGMTVCLSTATTPFTKTASATAAFSGGVK